MKKDDTLKEQYYEQEIKQLVIDCVNGEDMRDVPPRKMFTIQKILSIMNRDDLVIKNSKMCAKRLEQRQFSRKTGEWLNHHLYFNRYVKTLNKIQSRHIKLPSIIDHQMRLI